MTDTKELRRLLEAAETERKEERAAGPDEDWTTVARCNAWDAMGEHGPGLLDELDRLRASNTRLIEALRPFAQHGEHGQGNCTCMWCTAARVLREETTDAK